MEPAYQTRSQQYQLAAGLAEMEHAYQIHLVHQDVDVDLEMVTSGQMEDDRQQPQMAAWYPA